MEVGESIIRNAVKSYPVLIQFKEVCCGEDEETCKEGSPLPGVDPNCDCNIEDLRVDAVGDRMAEKGFPNVEIAFYLPKVGAFSIDTRSSTSLFGSIDSEKPYEVAITRFSHVYTHLYSITIHSLANHPLVEVPMPVIIEKPHYEVKGWVKRGKGVNWTVDFSTPEVVSIEPPNKGHVSYVVLVPRYDVIIDVEPNGVAKVTIWDSSNYGPVCIEPLVRDLRHKILD